MTTRLWRAVAVEKVLKIDQENPELDRIETASQVIRAGGVVAFPTDTVYGLGADAFNEAAVERIFRIKKRPVDKPLLVLVSNISEVRALVPDISPLGEKLIEQFWPGPLTLIFPAADSVPFRLAGEKRTVGLRIPAARIALFLVKSCRTPLTAPSANLTGEQDPLTAGEVLANLGTEVDLVIDGGKAQQQTPSTVVDLTCVQPKVLRWGAMGREKLARFGLA